MFYSETEFCNIPQSNSEYENYVVKYAKLDKHVN